MAHPYTEPAAVPLTSEDTDFLRQRLQTDEATLQNARAGRLNLQMQLASRDRVITTLERSIENARQALGEEPVTDYPMTSQGDRVVHVSVWSDPSPTGRYQSPEPAGRCSGCQEPLWPSVDGVGVVHAYGGADCFPDRDDTPQAELAEPVR